MTDCPVCLKPDHLCLCAELTPQPNRHEVLILQHPQEPDKTLGTAALAKASLQRCELRVGLSWPNFAKALGRTAENRRWGVLYLGSATAPGGEASPLSVLTRKGAPHPEQRRILDELEGFLVLDGTWSQAKSLWWRNAWLLKLNRLVLHPSRPSLYGKLRREPRKESISTIESVALTLNALGEDERIGTALTDAFKTLLNRYRGGSS